ncbi:MAG TPA: hypothetical protein VH969_02350 [Actinophytocola sp.]|jgi:hypothetical protein|uniref:Rv0361 family membrane protein n=1 Tax=Actinophytocola sp. TaxID=1872138 RepID=UPI002F92CAD2
MTYPPQPPGPPGPQQPPGPYNQGPYNHGPYQGPPPGPHWGPGPQGGYPVGPPPKKPRKGLITALVLVAILVVGGGGVGVYLLLTRDDPRGQGSGGGGGEGGVRAAAQTYVREMENVLNTPLADVDLGKLEPVTCAADFSKMDAEIKQAKDFGESSSASQGAGDRVQVRMKNFERTSDGATFTMTRREVGDDDADSVDMTVAKEGGDWKVCGVYEGENDSGPGGDGQDGGEDGGPSSGELPPNPIPTT